MQVTFDPLPAVNDVRRRPDTPIWKLEASLRYWHYTEASLNCRWKPASFHTIIRIAQFHWPDETGTPVEDSWNEMVRLINEGKMRLGGVSNFHVSLLERCEAIRHVDSLQPPFSLIRRQAAAEHEIPWCAQHKTGVICYSPMQSGLLTDTFSREQVARFAEDDWRRRSPDFNEPSLSRNLALHDALYQRARLLTHSGIPKSEKL